MTKLFSWQLLFIFLVACTAAEPPPVVVTVLPARELPPATPTAIATLTPVPSATPEVTETAVPTLTPTAQATETAVLLSNPTTAQFEVPATAMRLETGFFVAAGQQIRVRYENGRWRAGPANTWPPVGPTGDLQVPRKPTLPIPNAAIMSLVGGIGNETLLIGRGHTWVSQADGTLWLSANDDGFHDNDGLLLVEVTLLKTAGLSPIETVNRYWDHVSNRAYLLAWEMLSPRFQQENHPEGFGDYVEGFRALEICEARTNDGSLIQSGEVTATVSAQLELQARADCVLSQTNLNFDLVFDANRGHWVIDVVYR